MVTDGEGGARVSILDGSALRGDALARVLRSQGYGVVALHTDAEGFLSTLVEARAQLACIDVELPGNDGLAVLAEARQFHPDLQVLALGEGTDLLDRCIAAGAAAYLDARTSRCDEVVHALGLLSRGERAVSADLLSAVFRTARAPEHERLRPLSARERQVLAWVAAGADNGRIAASLAITERTVKAHVSSLYRKLRQENRTQLALLARQLGIRPPAGAA